ncbi:MAG: glucose-6-phosphate dehydrogenase assembly protein OpcA [Solirubrobacteraceae bacterium]
MTTLWDTTGSDVVRALEAERRSAGALAFGLALTLVVVTDQESVAQAEAAAKAAASAHPCRILLVIRRHLEAPDPRLDAEVLIGGRLGPGEAVVMRMFGRLALHAESVVLPLLAPDAPVVTWWHGAMPDKIAYDPLGVFADRRVTESMHSNEPMAALQQRAVDYAPGDTDLSWARTTSWRALVAAAFDSLSGTPKSAMVKGAETPPTALLVGWLRSKLGIDVHLTTTSGREIQEVSFDLTENGAPAKLSIKRRDERSAVITRSDQADRIMPLAPRDLGDLLAEDVRRLDADEVFAEALSAWTGVKNLSRRSPKRSHIWHDPMTGETKADVAEIAEADEKARRAAAKSTAKATKAAPAKAATKSAAKSAAKTATKPATKAPESKRSTPAGGSGAAKK